ILVRACDWEGTAFAKLTPLPRDGRAVTSWANPDEAWKDVARGIRAAVEQGVARTRPATPLGAEELFGSIDVTLDEVDEAIRAIDKQLADARRRRLKLQAAGASTAEVDDEIRGLRRRRREGGQLHP